MGPLQLLRQFLTKEDFNYKENHVTVHQFHPQIRIFFAGYGIFSANPDSWIRFVWPVLSLTIVLIAIAFELMFIYHGITTEDYQFATECFCYFIIIGTLPIIDGCFLLNRNKLLSLLDDMASDFQYICRLESRYKDRFFKGQLQIWQLCWMWLGFMSFIFTVYLSTTFILLIYQSLFATQDEHMVRPLIFPMWLPQDDPYRTPNYEIFMCLQILISVIAVFVFGVYVYIVFHLLLHYYNQMNIIILAFQDLFNDLDESVVELPRDDPLRVRVQDLLNKRIKRIVLWHRAVVNAVNVVASVFGPILVYQVLFSSVVICLTAYQVSSELDKGRFDYRFLILGYGSCLQLWIPCNIGTLMRNKAFSLGDACWSCGWHDTSLGRLVRQDILIIMLRSQKPMIIEFTCLPNLQLETFSSIMRTAYTYFNMLRQYN